MKPVAWIDEETTCFVYSQSEYEELSEYDKGGLIPLYTAPRELSDDFILEHHMGYVSPDGEFYAPDYKTWKEDGFTPVYKEPVLPRELSDDIGTIAYMSGFSDGKKAQLKQLSDEEIKAIELQISEGVACYDDFDFVAFSRAILKKASEK